MLRTAFFLLFRRLSRTKTKFIGTVTESFLQVLELFGWGSAAKMFQVSGKTFGFLLLFFICYLLLLLLLPLFPEHSLSSRLLPALQPQSNYLVVEASTTVDALDRCRGQRVYVYELPRQFNKGLLEKCNNGLVSWLNFCPHIANCGFGQLLNWTDGEGGRNSGWYGTDAYMLEVIFHSRIQSYSCLTNDSAQADALFVPYYAGVDALQYLYNRTAEGEHGKELVNWLEKNASDAWQRWNGRDHFMVMGRTSWDFAEGGWGTRIQGLSHVANMTTLYIERNPWVENQIAVPYPTSFHPSDGTQIQEWIHKVKTARRKHLFSFSGGIRATMKESIRGELMRQCAQSQRCVHVDCGKLRCGHDPRPTVEVFLRSEFCLQPRGDTPTRRSAFDAMISGCIPVFFHQDSAYTQYIWHLPSEPSSYSVYISEDSIKESGGIQIEDVLVSYSAEQIENMRNTIVSIVPKLIYGMPSSEERLGDDAFDISLRRVLQRVADLKSNRREA